MERILLKNKWSKRFFGFILLMIINVICIALVYPLTPNQEDIYLKMRDETFVESLAYTITGILMFTLVGLGLCSAYCLGASNTYQVINNE